MPTEHVPLPELQERLGYSPNGLSQAEAARRLAEHGPNELIEAKVSTLRKLLAYFWGPIPWMIEVAAVLSAAVQHWIDLAIILVLLLANAVVGFWEEYQAGNAVAALKARLAIRARVRRDGNWTTLPSRELVPGDVVRLRLGDIVPADARLLTAGPVEIDQSALTGESLPVTRGSDDDVYSGSIVRRGEADALVFATGAGTFFGRTAQLVESTQTVSHFQRAVMKIGDYLIAVAITLVSLIIIVAIYRGEPLLTTLQFALVLTIAAIPVAMPAVLSVTMAVGARVLARREAIVTRLASVEELAGIDVLCADKTGTLTENKLTLGEPFVLAAADPAEVILAAALASRAEDQDLIDLAVLGGLSDPHQVDADRVSEFQPFDPTTKRTEAAVEGADGRRFHVSKGAPQVILALAAAEPDVLAKANAAVDDFARTGYRSLGVARTDERGRWQVLGIIPIYDPPRRDSRQTIASARQLGVNVKMLTGDQVAIACEIAKQVGLGANVADASIFEGSNRDGAQIADAIDEADGFAQVFPEDKYYIIDSLQRHGHIVGMTGDGVNDAPALRRADAGIAVSGATDAARAAADIVLLTTGLAVIVDAIAESRRIFERMKSYAIYRIAETIRLLFFLTLAIIVFNFYPVTPVMIVLLALLNDAAIISIAYDNTRPANEPQSWDMLIVLGVATALGIAGVVESFGLLYLAERVFGIAPALIPTLIYLKLSVAGHLTVFVARTRGPFWSVPPSRILLAAVIGTQTIATLITVYGAFMAPIGWTLALAVWVYALFFFLIEDRVKLLAYQVVDRAERGLLRTRSTTLGG